MSHSAANLFNILASLQEHEGVRLRVVAGGQLGQALSVPE